MAGIKDRVSAALGKDTTHGTHGTTGLNDGNTGMGTGGMGTGGMGTGTGGMTSGTTGTGMGTGGMGTGGMGTGTGGMTSGTTGTGMGTRTGGMTSGITGTGLTGGQGGYDTTHTHHHGTGELIGGSEKVIDSKTFTKTEDHEVLIEKKAYELEHRPVEKEYIVETRYVGEAAVAGAPTELVGTETREVEERVVEAPRGDRAVVVENVDVPVEMLQQTHTHSATGLPGTGHTYGTTGVGSTSGTGGTTGTTSGVGGTNTSSF